MRSSFTAVALAAAVTLMAPVAASAHPGGLNAEGCHNNRKTGGYHCHRAGSTRSTSGAGQRTADRTVRFSSGSATARGAAGGQSFEYPNCAAARAAGAAPVRRGQPGYGPHLDRDGDGVGCEPYRGR